MSDRVPGPAAICPVILSGGVGSRLWPLSSDHMPKQFRPLLSDRSMLQETALRICDPQRFAAPMVVTHAGFAAETARQLASVLPSFRLLLEPHSRGTAPAIAFAAFDLLNQGRGDEVMLVLPADHLIQDLPAFGLAVQAAAALARAGHLVTLGIQPTVPLTGYGYIRVGEPLPDSPAPAFAIRSFKEKPDLATAREYILGGGYVWNAGIFLFRAADLLDELACLCPELIAAARCAHSHGKAAGIALLADETGVLSGPSGSFDVLVMERTRRGAVVPAAIGWSDVGSWDALWQLGSKDADGNVLIGNVVAHGAANCYARAESGATLAILGVQDVIVVATSETVLVAHRDASEKIKILCSELKRRAIADG